MAAGPFLPLEIQNELELVLLANAFEIIHVESVKSAQHLVFIVTVQRGQHREEGNDSNPFVDDLNADDADDARSSSSSNQDSSLSLSSSSCWREALKIGSSRLVIRIWQGGCRWWNLHRRHANRFSDAVVNATSRNEDPDHDHDHHRDDNDDHQHILALARAEIAGYRMARSCADSFGQEGIRYHGRIIIPQVLHFSHDRRGCCDDNNNHDNSNMIWAVFTYVGSQSGYFQSSNNTHDMLRQYDDTWTTTMIPIREEFGFPEPHLRWGRLPIASCWSYVATLLRTWIIPLHEYCFTMMFTQRPTSERLSGLGYNDDWMIRDLAVCYCIAACGDDARDKSTLQYNEEIPRQSWKGRTYWDMVLVYKQAYQELWDTAQRIESSSSSSSSSSSFTSLSAHDDTSLLPTVSLTEKGPVKDSYNGQQEEYEAWRLQWARWVLDLGSYIEKLKLQALNLNLDPPESFAANRAIESNADINDDDSCHQNGQFGRWIPFVLCHMDCQPQNLLCFRKDVHDKIDHCDTPSSPRRLPDVDNRFRGDNDMTAIRILSVLDWEDAALADPRFEILILCRKVCANLEQARCVWNMYANECQISHRIDGIGVEDAMLAIGTERMGPIEPWLQLETVHAITTMLLQSNPGMVAFSDDGLPLADKPLNGRNSWETPRDVQGKLRREYERLSTQWPFLS